jgi:hypothetical protein
VPWESKQIVEIRLVSTPEEVKLEEACQWRWFIAGVELPEKGSLLRLVSKNQH